MTTSEAHFDASSVIETQTTSSLPAMRTGQRLGRLVDRLLEADLSGLWVSRPVNVRYLCGFTGSNSQLLVRAEPVGGVWATLFTDGRYELQAAKELSDAGVSDTVGLSIQSGSAELGMELSEWPLSAQTPRFGFEANHLTVERHSLLVHAMPESRVVASSVLVSELRQVKDHDERLRLEAASAIADAALAESVQHLRVGMTETKFAGELEFAMRRLGSERPSFSTIVASGPNSASPHHQPTNRPFADGDLIVVDFGATVDGYGSDMTRTFVVGGSPDARSIDLYDAVAAAQAAGVALVAPGVALADIDLCCRSILDERGYGEYFMHGTGHGLGLEIHEEPMLSRRSVGSLEEGLIVTIEPGAYVPGFGGVRVEDTVVVTETGCEPITHAPKGLVF